MSQSGARSSALRSTPSRRLAQRLAHLLAGLALALVAMAWLTGCPAPAQTPVRFPGSDWDQVAAAKVSLDPMRFELLARDVGGAGLVVMDGRIVARWGGIHRNAGWGAVARPVLDNVLLFAVEEGVLPGLDVPIRPFVASEFSEDAAHSMGDMTFGELAGVRGAIVRPVDYSRLLFGGVYGSPPDEVARAPERFGALRPQDAPLFGGHQHYELVASPRDLARIGLLWLNGGYWQGMQLLPGDLLQRILGTVDETTGPVVAGEPWINTDRSLWPELAPDTWVIAGAEGALVIMPGSRVVAVWHSLGGSTPAPADLARPLGMLREALQPIEPLSTGLEALRLPADTLELDGFRTEPGPVSTLISLAGEGAAATGAARHRFTGAAGIYDIVVAYHDEADGQGRLEVRVDGVLADEWVLDRDPNFGHADPANLVLHRAARGVPLAPGSTLELQGVAHRNEGIRVAYIDLVPTDVSVVASREQ